MKRLFTVLCILSLTLSANAGQDDPIRDTPPGNPDAEIALVHGSLHVEKVTGQFVGDTGTFTFHVDLEIDNLDLPSGIKWSGFSNSFVVSSVNGATWSGLQGRVSDAIAGSWGGAVTIVNWSDGDSPDSISFKTTSQPQSFLSSGEYQSALTVSVLLHRSDRGTQICLDSLSIPPSYPWRWDVSSIANLAPAWGGKYCFTVSAPYRIDATAGSNGTISPSGSVDVPPGSDQTFSITADYGYHVADVRVDGLSVGPVGSYIFTAVSADHAIHADFAVDTFTILATATANGTITPSGSVPVAFGQDQSFSLSPTGQGYLVDLFVDSVSVGAQSSYTFSGVTADHTIFALFNDSTFVPTQQYSADIMFLQATDLDQDNYTDIVYSTSGLANPDVGGLWIAFGLPGGTFEPPVRLLNARRTPMALGFVNTDTLIDIVAVGGVDGQEIYMIKTQPARAFVIDSIPYSGAMANSIVAAYLNSDAYVDFLLGNGIIVFGGMNSGASQSQIEINAVSLNVADLNSDGFKDIAVGQGDSIKLLINDGVGGFTQSSAFFAGHSLSPLPPARAIADLNGDGNPDIASVVLTQDAPTNQSLATVGFSDGLGGFLSVFTKVLDGYAVNAQIADVDRDHHLDVVSSCGSNLEQRVIVLYGDGAGNFPRMSETNYPTSSGATLAISTGDWDRDGNPDFVTGSYQGSSPISVMYSTPPDAHVLSDEMVVTVFSEAGGFNNRRARSGNSEVTLEVTNPSDFTISQNSTTVSGSFYWQLDADGNLILDNRTIDYNLEPGEYTIVVRAEPNSTNPTYSVVVGIDGSQQARLASNSQEIGNPGAAAADNDSVVYYFRIENPPAINPQSGIPTSNAQPIVSWPLLFAAKRSAGLTYDFQLSQYTDFRSLVDSATGLVETKHMIESVLTRNAVYFWRVREVEGGTAGEWSHHYSLYVSSGCCDGYTGNVDCDPLNDVDIADLAALLDHLFITFGPLCCGSEADVDGSGNIDVSDITVLIQNLYLDPEYRQVETCPL